MQPAGVEADVFGGEDDVGGDDGRVFRAGVIRAAGVFEHVGLVVCDSEHGGGTVAAWRDFVRQRKGFRRRKDVNVLGLVVFCSRCQPSRFQYLFQLFLIYGCVFEFLNEYRALASSQKSIVVSSFDESKICCMEMNPVPILPQNRRLVSFFDACKQRIWYHYTR